MVVVTTMINEEYMQIEKGMVKGCKTLEEKKKIFRSKGNNKKTAVSESNVDR